jgi:hypothetical protein
VSPHMPVLGSFYFPSTFTSTSDTYAISFGAWLSGH